MCFAHFCPDIRQEWISDGNLVYSGKIMGLCNYGNINKEWLPHFKKFYYSKPDGEDFYKKLKQYITDTCGLVFDENKRLEKEISWDVAATSQAAFEECFFEVVDPYLKKYQDLPIIITGGCGLNILLASKIKTLFPERPSFVAPNTNDCGIALGLLAGFKKPKKPRWLGRAAESILDIEVLNLKFCSEIIISNHFCSGRTIKYIPPSNFSFPVKINFPFFDSAVSLAYCFPPK